MSTRLHARIASAVAAIKATRMSRALVRRLGDLGSSSVALRTRRQLGRLDESARRLSGALIARTSLWVGNHARVQTALERAGRRLGARGVKAVAILAVCILVATPVLGAGVVTGLVLQPGGQSSANGGNSSTGGSYMADGGSGGASGGAHSLSQPQVEQDGLTTYQISGTVTSAASDSALSGIAVTAYDSTGTMSASAQTASDGTYTISVTPAASPATYTIGF